MFFLSKLKKILIILYSSKIIFKDPNKTDILVLDDQGADRLKPLIENYNYCILPIRVSSINELYFSLKVLNNLIRNIRKTKLSTAYFCSIIEAIGPKLIITSIDNSLQVSDIAKILSKKFNFLAIQNAARYELDEYGKKHSNRFFIPEFACFGNFDKSLYRKHNVKVKKFFVCGSLNLSLFKDYLKKLSRKKKTNNYKKYDICLVSEASRGWDKLFPGVEKSIAKVAEFTIRLAKKHNLKLVFAAKRTKFIFEKSVFSKKPIKRENEAHKNEIKFYKKYLKVNFKFLQRNVKKYSSYHVMLNSNLTIAMMSTLLRESLALRGKVLACNFTNYKIWNFPIQGICSLNNMNFEEFEKRVLKLLSISHRNYILSLKKSPKYLVYYSKNNSTKDLLKKRIKSFI